MVCKIVFARPLFSEIKSITYEDHLFYLDCFLYGVFRYIL